MSEPFEQMLQGGHPNSLGRTQEVVNIALADQGRLEDLFATIRSEDAVVRLRVGDALGASSYRVLQRYLTSSTDWIVLNVTMDVLTQWAGSDPGLRIWLVPQLERLSRDSRKSVATRAGKRLAEIRRELNESGA